MEGIGKLQVRDEVVHVQTRGNGTVSKAAERGALQARTGRAERGQYMLKLSMHASSMHHTKLGPRTGVR